MTYSFCFKKSSGFSLVGLLIAAFIIVIITIASSALFGQAQRASSIARQEFIATNVAREGLELVHGVRDTNWFTSDERTRWLDHGLCSDGVNSFSENNRTIIIDAATVRNGGTAQNGSGVLYIKSGTNEWSLDSSGTQTPFTRIITIDCSTKGSDPEFITVTSTVSWQQAGQPKSVELKEKLYNWLPENRKTNP